jgi:hypothetical protein
MEKSAKIAINYLRKCENSTIYGNMLMAETTTGQAGERTLIATDEGTHSSPVIWRVYEEENGRRFAKRSHGGSNESEAEYSVKEADEETSGRLRWLNS